MRFLETKFQEVGNSLSPNGKLMAYVSDESGRLEVYVQTYPISEQKWPVSRGGGAVPRWRRDGRELFYLALDGRLVAVPIALLSTGRTPETGTSVPLFTALLGSLHDIALHQYIVSADGQRFLIDTVVEEAASPIVVILNWKRRAG